MGQVDSYTRMQRRRLLVVVCCLIAVVAILVVARRSTIDGHYSTEIVGYLSSDAYILFRDGVVTIENFGGRTSLGSYFQKTDGDWEWNTGGTQKWLVKSGVLEITCIEVGNETNVVKLARRVL